ncbi:MAG: hypothetical protein ABSE90_06970 [Verrucomicrobiota bacterium]
MWLAEYTTPTGLGRWLARRLQMPLLTELGVGINDVCLFHENDVRFLKQF